MHQLKKQVKKYRQWDKKPKAMVAEVKTCVDDVATTSIATQTDPIKYLFEGREFSWMVEVQTRKSTVA